MPLQLGPDADPAEGVRRAGVGVGGAGSRPVQRDKGAADEGEADAAQLERREALEPDGDRDDHCEHGRRRLPDGCGRRSEQLDSNDVEEVGEEEAATRNEKLEPVAPRRDPAAPRTPRRIALEHHRNEEEKWCRTHLSEQAKEHRVHSREPKLAHHAA